ncbi:class I SAM-dependent methyltransferase [uncultured Pelagimonas sp.]|uniref:class I SAM-dependent methyltransferase n=1 Tax=uncultured Pelagimonas sp. TaxID=1618102 RepID=UPI00262FC082|nr:class I SAM-dependent methyltransferase [uncultured Pelagimonas sp.]
MEHAQFWDKIARKYANDPIGNMPAYEATLARVRELITPDMSVLEIGCGTGTTALKLADAAGHYTGTDISSEMIKIANEKRVGDGVENLTFDVADAGRAPGHYDAVLAFNLIHLVADPEATLAHVHSQLPEGGLFISKTPCLGNKPWFIPLIALMQLVGKAPKPVHSLRPNRLKAMLEDAGFDVEEMMFFPKQNISRFIVARKRSG